jgi:transcriptional regulator with XRE-family HTH domain
MGISAKIELLKQRRKEKKMTQGGVGDAIGVTPQYIGKIERGEANPSLVMIEKLAEALDCELRLLLK